MTGPDGAIWFSRGNFIGRMTLGGELTDYRLPSADAYARAITPGPDGALCS